MDLVDAVATLTCVETDVDSPKDFRPYTTDCPDPNRENNPPCPASWIEILDSPKVLGNVPAGSNIGANFWVSVPSTLTTSPEIEMILGVRSDPAGKSVEGIGVSRHKLNVDELSLFYSTDFPTGGTEWTDYSQDEIEDVVTENLGDFLLGTIQKFRLPAGDVHVLDTDRKA